MKKITSLFLALIMVLSVSTGMATTAFAAYENTYKNTGNQRTDIVQVAKTQLGYTEGKNNNTKYGAWYGLNYNPWCAMFVSWCARQAGIPTSVIKNSACAGAGSSYFNIPYYNGSNYTPKSGDIFFTKDWSHVGIVYYTDGNYFYTIEGNSNNNGSAEGYCVCTNRRYIPNFYFGVPNYKGSSTTAPSTTKVTSFSTNFKLLAANYVTAYNGMNGSNIGRIYSGDTINVITIYSNGWAAAKCSWTGGTIKTVYFRVGDLKFKCTKYINAYSDANAINYIGRAYIGDICTLKSVNSKTLYCACPWNGGTKSIYLKLSDFNTTSVTSNNYISVNFYLKAANYVNAYSSVNGSKIGRIYTGDKIQITKIYKNNWAECRCPWGNSTKTVYFKVTELKFKCTKYINAYSDANAINYIGRAYTGDICTLKSVNSKTLYCACPWGSGSKNVYLKLSDMK
ncbi:MAG: CHAP domain-containing protein [Ruminococcaceae bacterium]|nr:CHAP domain-containing protein [Oscillospiraceae bacterium]